MSALSTELAAGTATSGETFAEQRSSAYSTMIMVPPGPGKTDHLIPGISACARAHRDMSCLVVICAISVTPVITASLLSRECRSALRGHGDWVALSHGPWAVGGASVGEHDAITLIA
jgi:hypothetical protein